MLLSRDTIDRTGCAARAMSAITSSGQVASSMSVNSVIHPPDSVSRRPSSRAMLVFPHAPLPRQQHVIAVADALLQDMKFRITVEEVGTAYPAPGR